MGKDSKASKPKPSSKDTSDSPSSSSSSKLKPATAINVRHILCEKQSQLLAAKSRVDAGEPFDAVARELSADKARQGGSLGWKVRGSLLAEFERVAYGLPASSSAKPVTGEVKTSEGYHLIMVEGRR